MKILCLLVLGAARVAAAQDPAPPIRDNSLLVEEAYNQEAGVVQHALLFGRDRASRDWELGFTQEWPLGGETHQLSYTIPVVRSGVRTGVGDAALTYRYRWLAAERAQSVVRLTALLPTGDFDRGLGAGGAGVELAVPASFELGRSVAAHWNVGGSLVPAARADDGSTAATREIFAGGSLIWLAHPALNLLAELLWSRAEAAGPGSTRSAETSLTVVPGVRGAINIGPAQVVPAGGLLVDLADGARVAGFVLYLSFEHPFGRAR
jgi:hypothetical protein